MNEPAPSPPWAWTVRLASPRETSDVLRAVAGLCRTNGIPRQTIVKAYDARAVVEQLGPSRYLACDYGPGVHCLLAMVRIGGGRTVCAIVHWDGAVRIARMPPFKTKVFKGTVLEGVLVRAGLFTTFRAFDCLAFVRRGLIGRPYTERASRMCETARMNFPKPFSSVYTQMMLQCSILVESNTACAQNFIKGPNVLFIPIHSEAKQEYARGENIVALLNHPEGTVEAGTPVTSSASFSTSSPSMTNRTQFSTGRTPPFPKSYRPGPWTTFSGAGPVAVLPHRLALPLSLDPLCA